MGGRFGAVEQDNAKGREIANLLSNCTIDRLTESKKILTRRRREYFPVLACCSRRLKGNKASAWRFSFF